LTSSREQSTVLDPPQRVTTLELCFDLVFVFTITQLTSTLAEHVMLAAAGRLLLVFGANRNIRRILPFNLTSPVLVIIAGLTPAPAAYAPMIVAFGESVADVGLGAESHAVTVALALSATLALALTASLWWAFFGTGDDDRAEESLTAASPERRPWLVLAACFYAYIPMLLGIAATAAGLKNAIGHPGTALTAGPAIALAGGVTLFRAGDVAFRQVMGIGSPRHRALAAVLALAAWPLSVAVDAAAGIALLTAVVAGTLAVGRQAEHATVKA
jgi:low temperature requirement protein LtrA